MDASGRLLHLAPGDAPKALVDVDGQLRGSSAQILPFASAIASRPSGTRSRRCNSATPPLSGALMLDVAASILRPFLFQKLEWPCVFGWSFFDVLLSHTRKDKISGRMIGMRLIRGYCDLK